MRRQGYKLYAASLALLLLASCSRQDSAWGDSDDMADRRPLAVASLQAPVSSPLTRVTTSPLPADGEVGFFVLADAPHYSAVTNKKGVFKADQGLWLPTDSIWLSRVAAKLALYYPYDDTQATAGKLNLTAIVRPADGSKDLCSARFEADSHTKDISLTLTQLYSRLTVTFVKMADVEYTGTSSLTALKLEGAGIYPTATYTFADGTYTYPGATGYTATLNPAVTIQGTNADAADATKVDLLLPPYQTLTQDLTLTATVDTKEMKIVIPKAKLASTLTAGKQYNVTVKLKPTALVLGSVQTTDWDSQTAFDEEAKMENPRPEFFDIGLEFLIAPGNVRAIKQADGTYKYTFADSQGYYSGVNNGDYDSSGGDYFCWNTLDPSLIDVHQTEWKDERDPCRKIGDGNWYTPTHAELMKIFDGTSNTMTLSYGNYVMPNGDVVEGYYVGRTALSPDKDTQDEHVFVPFTGYRSGTQWKFVNSSISYWSSTLKGNDNAYCSYSDSYSPVAYNDFGINTGIGNPIRCIRPK